MLPEGVDWVATAAFWKEIVVAGAAVAAACIAYLGLAAWKKQLHGRSGYELARRLLRAVYSVRDRIVRVRTPLEGDPDESIHHVQSRHHANAPPTGDCGSRC